MTNGSFWVGKGGFNYKKSGGAEEKRLNLRMVLPDNYILEEQLTIFREKIKEKYGEYAIINNF